jgi:hypothetical protein
MNSPALHCDSSGLIQPIRESSPIWYARNMDQPQDEPVRYVAADYRAARQIALSHFNGAVVAVWRDGEERL